MNAQLLFCLLGIAMSATALGAQIPEAGTKDSRIRFADYDPFDVVTIYTRVGLETHVVLDQDEKIVDMTGGDVEAWGIATKLARNGVFLKPVGELADTNLHVITNKRTYSFDLRLAKKSKGEIGFMTVYFRYPVVERQSDTAAREAKYVRELLDVGYPATNREYSVEGSSLVAPISVWDDGRTTFLRFRSRSSIPAIYSVRTDGRRTERIENITTEDDIVQVHGVRAKLVLRLGDDIACVFNERFDLDAPRPATNTASPNVVRTLKGTEK
jgi:type IV secretion system protein VirB9